MRTPVVRRRLATVMMVVGAVLVGCGTVATPRPTFEPTSTFNFSMVITRTPTNTAEPIVQVEGQVTVVAVQPTEVVTDIPEPPTDTPMPEPTATPTAVPTVNTLPGDPDTGAILFNQVTGQISSTGQGCSACHNPNEPLAGPGPYLYGIADVADQRRPGYTAYEYLYESIVNPMAFIAPVQGDFTEWPQGNMVNAMPQDWGQKLTEDQINDIIAYLLTLTAETDE